MSEKQKQIQVAAEPPVSRARVCSVDGCERKLDASGLCAAHRSRLLRLGDLHADRPIGWRLEIVHGTYDGYRNHGCRCRPCTEAHTVYIVARNHRKGWNRPAEIVRAERRAEAEARDNHGTETRYTSLGCRCAECRAAASAARRLRRQRTLTQAAPQPPRSTP